MTTLGKQIIAGLGSFLRDLKAGKTEIRVVRGSTNVYADLGLPDADELLAESKRRVELETKAEGED